MGDKQVGERVENGKKTGNILYKREHHGGHYDLGSLRYRKKGGDDSKSRFNFLGKKGGGTGGEGRDSTIDDGS